MKINGSLMTRLGLWMAVGLGALALGCGSSVADPCTTEADCGGQICLNKNYAPGGYCSKPCTPGVEESCPGGTVCVRDIIAKDQPGCLRSCTGPSDCRKGYGCEVIRESSRAVCIGPEGI